MTEAYISTRCKKILYMIMASDTYVSLPQISEEFKLSKRSIYYELCKINDWLSVQGINEITVVRGKGIKLTEEEMKEIEKVNKHTPFYKVTKESLQRLATTKCNFEDGE